MPPGDAHAKEPPPFPLPQLPLNVPLPQWRPAPGVERAQRPLAFNADSNAKLTHLAECGRAITAAHERGKLDPELSAYMGPMRQMAEKLQISRAGSDEPGGKARGGCGLGVRGWARAGGPGQEGKGSVGPAGRRAFQACT